MKEKITSCAFTGHRELDERFDERRLRRLIRARIKEGVTVFYTGMARGFDLIATDLVLREKKKNAAIRVIACIPCPDQSVSYPKREKEKYELLLAACDEKILVSDHYFRGCMQVRNAYMEKHADSLIAYCCKSTGGSAYTKNLFDKKGKPVFSACLSI